MAQRNGFRRLTALGLFVTTLFALAVTACGGEDPPTAVWERRSGEEVFRGLVFSEGAVAARFPEIWGILPHLELTFEERERHERTTAQLVADLRRADPAFFDRFGAAMQSGDHLRIERAMDESAVFVKQALQGRGPSATARGDSVGTCITYAAIAVVIQGDIATVVEGGGGESAWAGTQLGREQVVELIAKRLVVE